MRIATAATQGRHDDEAIAGACRELARELGGQPDFVVAYHTSSERNADVETAISTNLRRSVLIGSTSCRGAMTDRGLYGFGDFGLGLWGLRDAGGAYGAGFAVLGDDPKGASCRALEEALAKAGRPGETPEFVWIHATPGDEEAVLTGLDSVLGCHVPIAGGSTADEAIAGEWSCFTSDRQGGRAVSVAVMFPSTSVAYAFQSGYSPTGKSGIVTRADGRTIIEIDSEPAAAVYNRWTNGVIDGACANGGNILTLTTLHPLGREVGRIGEGSTAIPYYNLLHPECVTENRGLTIFARASEGERLHLMTGSTQSLIGRGGRVVADALRNGSLDDSQIAGGLVVFCAGCMLTIGEQMSQVVEVFGRAFKGRPFLGGFTFGEQGCFVGGENRHGNLMISVALFAA
jgi:hypothetical protein